MNQESPIKATTTRYIENHKIGQLAHPALLGDSASTANEIINITGNTLAIEIEVLRCIMNSAGVRRTSDSPT